MTAAPKLLPLPRERQEQLYAALAKEALSTAELSARWPDWYTGTPTAQHRLEADLDDMSARKVDGKWRVKATPAAATPAVRVVPVPSVVTVAPEPQTNQKKERAMARPRPETPHADVRQQKLREFLAGGPKSNAELAKACTWYSGAAGVMLLRGDAAAIGAARTGNRLSPWALPGSTSVPSTNPAPSATTNPAPPTPAIADHYAAVLTDLANEREQLAALIDQLRAFAERHRK